jgi:Flp pilus assembly protein TadG
MSPNNRTGNAKLRNVFSIFVNENGTAMIEAVLVLPLLIIIVVGILQFAIAMNIYMTATSAAVAGVQVFDTYRGIPNSYTAATTAAKNAMQLAAWKIATSDISISLWVNSSPCSADSSCDLALTNNGPPGSGGAGSSTKIQVQVNCRGLNLLPTMPFLTTSLSLPSLCPVIVQLNGVVQ